MSSGTAVAEAFTEVARLRAELAAAERRLSDRTGLCDRLSQQLRLVADERLQPARRHRRQLENACTRMGGALFGEEYQLPVQGLAESSDEEEMEERREDTGQPREDTGQPREDAGQPREDTGPALASVSEEGGSKEAGAGAVPLPPAELQAVRTEIGTEQTGLPPSRAGAI